MHCKVADCDKPIEARGYCIKHYARWRRHGSPDVVKYDRLGEHRYVRPPSDEYYAVHKRLRKERGPAKGKPCAICGAVAVNWAYDHRDPNERVIARPKRQHIWLAHARYSLDLDHYFPACARCHSTLDRYHGHSVSSR